MSAFCDIPEDVRAAAKRQCDLAGVTVHSDMRVHCEHVAAFAIMEERKRLGAYDILLAACHKVVNNWIDLHQKDLMQLRAAIAAATSDATP